MIKSALVAMTIVGCDCDAKLCEYIGETPAQWTSLADCEAAMKSRVLKQGNHDYPLVTGICRTTEFAAPQLAAAEPLPAPRQPVVEANFVDDVVANGKSVLYRTANGYALVRDGLGSAAEATLSAARRSTGWVAGQLPAGF